jgi:hypothetical protein
VKLQRRLNGIDALAIVIGGVIALGYRVFGART